MPEQGGMGTGAADAAPVLPDRPPKYPGRMDKSMQGIEPVPFTTVIWDVLIAHGPQKFGPKLISLLGRGSDFTPAAWKEYLRYHHEFAGREGRAADWEVARREYIERALEQGVRRGWLKLSSDGVYSPGDEVPEHKDWAPLPERGLSLSQTRLDVSFSMPITLQSAIGSKVFAEVVPLTREQAMAVLSSKVRAKPDPKLKAELKRSLRQVGQLYPIIRWRPNTAVDTPWYTVDGVTREELLLKIRKEDPNGTEPIKYLDLPHTVPLEQVAGMRMAAELTGSTKTEASREQYIVDLAAQGIDHAVIGNGVQLARNTVTEILNKRGIYRKGKIDAHKAEILAMWDGGRPGHWTIQEIAEETGFSTGGVHLAIKRWAEEAESIHNVDPADIMNGKGQEATAGLTEKEGRVLAALAGHHDISRAELTKVEGLDSGGALTGIINKLIDAGLAEPVGKRKGSTTYRITDAGVDQVPELDDDDDLLDDDDDDDEDIIIPIPVPKNTEAFAEVKRLMSRLRAALAKAAPLDQQQSDWLATETMALVDYGQRGSRQPR